MGKPEYTCEKNVNFIDRYQKSRSISQERSETTEWLYEINGSVVWYGVTGFIL
jgi:hypothetical protein